MRDLVADTRLSCKDLVLPVFVADGISEPRPVPSMPGVYQHTPQSLLELSDRVKDSGMVGVMVFGVPRPEDKDPTGSIGLSPDCILNTSLTALRERHGDDLVLMADTCVDEFTSHGHCGVLGTNSHGDTVVDNTATLQQYQQLALAQSTAGAHVVSPSGMMDGQVAAIRSALDDMNHIDTSILAYSAKYASAFYGPFRDAVGSSLEGDRATYQQDYRNRTESLREIALDVAQGADMVMVKPAMAYMDIISDAAQLADVPIAAYQVSGEYSMIAAAGEKGWIDPAAALLESVVSLKRAGAGIILTYGAVEIAQHLS